MKFFVSIVMFTIVASCGRVWAYPDGAPPEACETLTPSHDDHEAQDSSAPYTILTDKSRVRGGEEVMVRVVGNDGATLRGFILVARENGKSDNLGQFASGDQSAAMTCNSEYDAATHVSNDDKAEVASSWIAPEGFSGKVSFTATVVQAYEHYWTGIKSSSVTVY